MDTVLIAFRLLLAAVFVTAGVGKLLDRPGARTALAEFGVPESLLDAGTVALPLAELAVAIALLIPTSARWGALGALLLLLSFIVAIAVAMSQGRAPDCHCFGQIHSEPAGKSTLVRNGVLAVMAVVVVTAGPGQSITGWVDSRSALELVITVVVVVALAAAAFFGDAVVPRANQAGAREAAGPADLYPGAGIRTD